MNASTNSVLPRLLYVGDVPVESSYHGSALLYRLLQNYPPEQLRIIETNLSRSQLERRLPDVAYAELRLGWRRPLYTRFARSYRAWRIWRAAGCHSQLPRLLSGFAPQAVLTVTHGFAWRTAARFAARHQLPLHLICHDDLPRCAGLAAGPEGWLDQEFGRVYRQAASRLCVSPFMRDAYLERYGINGEVLYPSRAADCPEYAAPPARLREPVTRLTVAFAGTINNPGYVKTLRLLAEALAALGGCLLIFGPFTSAHAQRNELNLPNVECRGMLSVAELMNRFRAEADVLFVPMSFAAEDRANMEISFPSKLTDYTAVGLPLLFFGPEYCSAVRWARENSGVAEVVTDEAPLALRAAVERLQEGNRRQELARIALRLGTDFFAHARAWHQFAAALGSSPRS